MQAGSDAPDFQRLIISASNLKTELPYSTDNSVFPFLRPIFTQMGASCGQAASVAYNFCYEYNRMYNRPSDTDIYQYPSHFVWNFMNATLPYYGEGVSYFHTFDILYDAGTPSIATYGPITVDDSYRWMSGFNGYAQAMHNRISAVNSIAAGTPDGLITLKHWLFDHAEGSATGGVANFYAGLGGYHPLPAGTEEAGKQAIPAMGPFASHAMTIVGYNDSIRYDINGDGCFTNDIDITGDGMVDMKDWEIGGLKFINSYGTYWADSGFCYMLYRTLALKYGQGGIWNNAVHVIFPDTTYKPQLALKANITYNKRGRLKIYAGISADTSNYLPDQTIELSVFNYQGGDYPMLGHYSPESKTIETGLDITPLLAYIKPGEPARLYLLIDENDPDHTGEGVVTNFSIIQYSHQQQIETSDSELPRTITDNSTTIASVVIESVYPPVHISPDTIVVLTETGDAQIQMQAQGGKAPYQWRVNSLIEEASGHETYDPPSGSIVVPSNPASGYAAIPMPFSFPYFGEWYDTLYMHVNGYLMFSKQDMPYYYLLFDKPFLQQIRAIAPAMNKDMGLYSTGDFLSIEPGADKITFRWHISASQSTTYADFTATLNRDGNIRFNYSQWPDETLILPVIGLGNGCREETQFSQFNQKKITSGQFIRFTSSPGTATANIDQSGMLSVSSQGKPCSGLIGVTATDCNRVAGSRRIQVTSGPAISISATQADARFYPGIPVPLTVSITNLGAAPMVVDVLSILPASGNLWLDSGNFQVQTIAAGATINLSNLFILTAADTITAMQLLKVEAMATINGAQYRSFASFHPALMLLEVAPPVIQGSYPDLQAGTDATLRFSIINKGSVPAEYLNARISITDPFAAITGTPIVGIPYLDAKSMRNVQFTIRTNEAAPSGKSFTIHLELHGEAGLILQKDFSLTIGQPQVLVIDLDKNHNSAVHIRSTILGLGIAADASEFIDSTLFNYNVAFLSLGFFTQNHQLTTVEDSLLVHYLEAGGNLYIEGGAFFKQDPPTMLRGLLGADGSNLAWSHPADSLDGISGTPVEGIHIDYRGDWKRGENLVATDQATPWFRDKNSGLDFVVSYQPGTYNTIASSIEFGGTFMYNGPGRPELMDEYLQHLGFETHPLSATFSATDTQICTGSQIMFTPNSSGSPLSYSWQFEGGEPAAWEGSLPLIRYPSAGDFDVTLTVSDGNHQNTFLIPGYIHVEHCAGIAEPLGASLRLIPNPAQDWVQLDFPSVTNETTSVAIYSANGTKIWMEQLKSEGNPLLISTKDFRPGLYLVSVFNTSIAASAKLIIR